MIGSINPTLAAATKSGFNPLSLVFIVLMVGVFYFLLIRPQQKRARGQRSLVDSLDVGDDVITIGGMHGTITELDPDSVLLEVAPDIEIRFIKSAIARKAPHMEGIEAAERDEAEEDVDGTK